MVYYEVEDSFNPDSIFPDQLTGIKTDKALTLSVNYQKKC